MRFCPCLRRYVSDGATTRVLTPFIQCDTCKANSKNPVCKIGANDFKCTKCMTEKRRCYWGGVNCRGDRHMERAQENAEAGPSCKKSRQNLLMDDAQEEVKTKKPHAEGKSSISCRFSKSNHVLQRFLTSGNRVASIRGLSICPRSTSCAMNFTLKRRT